MMDMIIESWDPTAAVAFVVWLSETCEMFRWQLCDVLQFEHYPNILHQAYVHPHGLRVSDVSDGALPRRLWQRLWTSTGMVGSITRPVGFHQTYPRRVRVSSYQTAGVMYALLMPTSTPSTVEPMSRSAGVLSRLSLVALITTLVAQSGANQLRVVLSLLAHEEFCFQLKFKITRPTTVQDSITTVELRLEDDENCDEPLEIFVMRVTGPSLHQYSLSGITLGFEAVFYQTMSHYCPNLRKPRIDGQDFDVITKELLTRDGVVKTLDAHKTSALAADQELIAQLLETPEVTSSPSNHLIVSRATLDVLFATFEQMQVRNLLVEIEFYPHLHVKFSFMEAHRASTTLALRPQDCEEHDGPLELFFVRRLGPHLRNYSIGGITSGFETAFYEALIVHCPNLTKLATRLPMVSLDEMVETSERLNSWTIRQMDIMLNNDVPLRSLLDALSSSIHPMSKPLSDVTLKQHIHEPDVTRMVLQLFEAVPQMRYPHIFRLHESLVLQAIKPIHLEHLSPSGVFDTIVPVDRREQLAFISVMAARRLAMELGIAEKVFAFASHKVRHKVVFSPAMNTCVPPCRYRRGGKFPSVLEEYRNR